MLLFKRFFSLYFLSLACLSFQVHGGIFISDEPSPAQRDYNLRIGELRLNLGANTVFQWNSNFNRSSSNEEAASSIIPTISIDAFWPISPYLQLSIGTNVGYQYFITGAGNEQDGLIIGGIDENIASRFGFDIGLSNDSIITVSNSFSANVASASIQNDAGQRQDQPFRRFNSVSTVRYAQRLSPQVRASINYNFTNTFTSDIISSDDRATNSAIDSIDSKTHGVSGTISTQVNDSLVLSLFGNFSDTRNAGDLRNDSRQQQIGPGLTYTSKSGLRSSVQFTLDQLDFDTKNNPNAQDDQSTTLTYQGSVGFVQNNFLSHNFSLNRQQRPSTATTSDPSSGDVIPVNSQVNTNFVYNLIYALNDRININLSYRLSRIKESDGGNKFYRETISVGLPLQLNTRIAISMRYNYNNVFGSEFNEFNYDQHSVNVNARLNF